MYQSLITSGFLIFTKIASDLFALPDIYTFFLYENSKKEHHKKWHYCSLLGGLIIDLALGTTLGTFFMLDVVCLILLRFLTQWSRYLDNLLVLYILRYTFLFWLGTGVAVILNQFFYYSLWMLFQKLWKIYSGIIR